MHKNTFQQPRYYIYTQKVLVNEQYSPTIMNGIQSPNQFKFSLSSLFTYLSCITHNLYFFLKKKLFEGNSDNE
jgi:hypothetical protein